MWNSVTTDQWILQQVKGVCLSIWNGQMKALNHSGTELCLMDTEIRYFTEKEGWEKRICQASSFSGHVISNVLLRTKRGSSNRMIINLKSFHQHVKKIHVKMDTLHNYIPLMKYCCFSVSIDLKDAYFSQVCLSLTKYKKTRQHKPWSVSTSLFGTNIQTSKLCADIYRRLKSGWEGCCCNSVICCPK